jgi:GNAT superfamily N-acetyltransferase
MMSVFFKRYRLRVDLPCRIPERRGADNISLVPWHPKLLGMHALAKWESFRKEMDGSVFPCLADREGCRQLMRDIVGKDSFVPEATWLAVEGSGTEWEAPLGTIQGLRPSPIQGAIQNIGVVPAARGRGIGRELIRRALLGFHAAGCRFVTLEVTIHNLAAIQLYHSVGFQPMEIVFKYGVVNLPRAT